MRRMYRITSSYDVSDQLQKLHKTTGSLRGVRIFLWELHSPRDLYSFREVCEVDDMLIFIRFVPVSVSVTART